MCMLEPLNGFHCYVRIELLFHISKLRGLLKCIRLFQQSIAVVVLWYHRAILSNRAAYFYLELCGPTINSSLAMPLILPLNYLKQIFPDL